MKKVIVFIIALLSFCHLQAQSLEGNWQVSDYKLKQKIKDKDKLAFVMAGAKAMKFNFVGDNSLFISNPFLSKPTMYNWKYIDAKKTTIEAVEVNPLFEDKPSIWTLKIRKLGTNVLHLEDLDKDKKGNIWVLSK